MAFKAGLIFWSIRNLSNVWTSLPRETVTLHLAIHKQQAISAAQKTARWKSLDLPFFNITSRLFQETKGLLMWTSTKMVFQRDRAIFCSVKPQPTCRNWTTSLSNPWTTSQPRGKTHMAKTRTRLHCWTVLGCKELQAHFALTGLLKGIISKQPSISIATWTPTWMSLMTFSAKQACARSSDPKIRSTRTSNAMSRSRNLQTETLSVRSEMPYSQETTSLKVSKNNRLRTTWRHFNQVPSVRKRFWAIRKSRQLK